MPSHQLICTKGQMCARHRLPCQLSLYQRSTFDEQLVCFPLKNIPKYLELASSLHHSVQALARYHLANFLCSIAARQGAVFLREMMNRLEDKNGRNSKNESKTINLHQQKG